MTNESRADVIVSARSRRSASTLSDLVHTSHSSLRHPVLKDSSGIRLGQRERGQNRDPSSHFSFFSHTTFHFKLHKRREVGRAAYLFLLSFNLSRVRLSPQHQHPLSLSLSLSKPCALYPVHGTRKKRIGWGNGANAQLSVRGILLVFCIQAKDFTDALTFFFSFLQMTQFIEQNGLTKYTS